MASMAKGPEDSETTRLYARALNRITDVLASLPGGLDEV
jgi:hypothetical protein